MFPENATKIGGGEQVNGTPPPLLPHPLKE
jgi:hypothetical protein